MGDASGLVHASGAGTGPAAASWLFSSLSWPGFSRKNADHTLISPKGLDYLQLVYHSCDSASSSSVFTQSAIGDCRHAAIPRPLQAGTMPMRECNGAPTSRS